MKLRSGPTAAAAALALLVSGAPVAMAQPAPDSGPSPSLTAQDDSAVDAAASDAETAREAWAGVDSDTGLWIVQLDGPSAATYGAENSLDSAGTAEYAEQLAAEHDDLGESISSTLGRDVPVTYSYANVLNGIAVEVDANEAEQLWDLPGVAAVYPDVERELQTDVSHEIIKSAAVWDGENGPGITSRGEGVIVAMIDSGVNPDHPSFAATDGFDYTHENPNGTGNFLGACDPDHPQYESDFDCNDKLIGAYTFNGPTARDTDDHGSHVGSTIAGNHHEATFSMGTSEFTREVQGVAPRANVISYKVCNPGCPGSATIASVDQAVADEVDVLNYSISGVDNPWVDAVDLAFLDAHDAGISVAASAGNSGPGPRTVAKTGPWNLSVAATTHDRVFGNEVSITAEGAPEEVTGLPGFPGDGPAITEDYVGNLVDAAVVGEVNGCSAFDDGVFEDSIALIQRGDCEFSVKVNNAEAAGATAVVMFNNVGGPPTAPGGLADITNIPAVMLTLADGEALQDYLAGDNSPEVVLGSDVLLVEDESWIDLVAGFSSRGPSQFDMLAPTIAAPGVNILAAFAERDGDPDQYGAISGTSMASPHAAGAVALLREVYPDLTPTQIRSVLASSADYDGLLKEDGATAADHFDIGSGRINIDQASRAGLAMDETGENFAAANPAIGGEPSELNLPAFVEWDCEGVCEWTRTVTSVSDASASYTAAIDAPEGVEITVTPSEFTLEPGAEQELTVSVNVSGGTVGEWAQGRVTLETTDAHTGGLDIADAQFPVAVMVTDTAPPEDTPVIEVDPEELASTQAPDGTGTEVLNIGNVGTADLEWEFVDELAVEGTLHEQEVNGTSGIVSDFYADLDAGVFSADDFELAASSSITSLYTPGFWVGDDVTTRATGIDWEIFADADGAPGDLVWSHSNTPDGTGVSIVDNEITLDVAAVNDGPLDLEAGTYWLSVWPTIPDADNLNDRWNWYQGTPTGAGGMLLDEDFLFGPGTGDWTSIESLVGTFSDVAFTVEGTSDPVVCGADWLTVDPVSGTTAPDGTTEVTAEFDATGLEEGDYTTQLCIESNDPATPGVTVPVTLTVEEPEAAPSITIDPESVEASQGQDEQTEQTLTIGNIGTADLDFAIEETEAGSAGSVASDYEAVELPVGSDRTTDAAVEGSAPAVIEGASVPLATTIEEGFEDVEGLPAQGWSIINTSEPVGGTSWFQGNVDVFEAHEGPEDSFAGANFNGTDFNGNISTWLVTPEVDLADGSELTFWTRSTDADWADRLEVRLSTAGDSDDVGTGFDDAGDFDEVLLTINEDLVGTGYPQEWTEFTVTVEGVEAGDTGRFAFRHHVPDGGAFGTHSDFVGVDTVSYETAAPACEATDIPWLTVDPAEGTVAPDGEQAITVGLDSTGLELGEHTAELCVTSNDPANSVVNVPVTLTVTDEPDEPAEVERIYGADRWATAAEIAAEFPDGADTVYIANGTESLDGADALASGAAAAKGALDFLPNATPEGDAAPILLVKADDIPSATVTALELLEPSNVVIVGGTGSVSEDVEDDLEELTGVAPERISGGDRYGTAAELASRYAPGLDTVYVATGVGNTDSDLALADALTAASLAGSQGSPVVLVQPDNLPTVTSDVLNDLEPTNIVLVGGEAAVNAAVMAELEEIAPTTRLFGANRYETAAALTAEYAVDGDMLYIASGTSFPDALTGSSLTGSQQAPLLVVKDDHLPTAIHDEILRLSPQGITIFGGSAAVNEEVEDLLQDLLDQTSID